MENKIVRIAVAPKYPKEKEKGVFTIYNLEMAESEVPKIPQIFRVLHDAEVEEIFDAGELQARDFHEVMYKNAIIDPQAQTIGKGFEKLGVRVEALKVGRRYYGEAFKGIYVNPNVEICFSGEPNLVTLKPEGFRPPMDTYDLVAMGDEELLQLSKDLNLSLSLKMMRPIREDQEKLALPVTDRSGVWMSMPFCGATIVVMSNGRSGDICLPNCVGPRKKSAIRMLYPLFSIMPEGGIFMMIMS